MVLDKRQKILLISFVIIILITIGLLYWNYSDKIIKISSPGSLDQPSQVDFSVFKDPRLKELKNFGQELDIGQLGRENPFEPY